MTDTAEFDAGEDAIERLVEEVHTTRSDVADTAAVSVNVGDLRRLLRMHADLRSRLACVVEATYWDRPYDTRINAVRGMCDLTTDGMTPAPETTVTPPDQTTARATSKETE